MRANTSLLGHVLGSNPSIAGYYELHIGYHSRCSFLHQRVKYFRDHPTKPGAGYIFDKILHNHHKIDLQLLNRHSTKTIFSIRPPAETIASIVKLFEKNPENRFQNPKYAMQYYIERLSVLRKQASQCERYFYFDASALRSTPDLVLSRLSAWLSLKKPLSEEFDQFAFTNSPNAGDSSGLLRLGKIDCSSIEYPRPELRESEIEAANLHYEECRRAIMVSDRNVFRE